MAGFAAEKSQRVEALHEERLVSDMERLEVDAQATHGSQRLAATRLSADRTAQSHRVRYAAQLPHIDPKVLGERFFVMEPKNGPC
jgi:hypothetical protein